jgi:hypothetical protein
VDQSKSVNAAATAENANRIPKQTDYNAKEIGMDQKMNITADSLTKIGGGGNSTGTNPLLDENKRQTNLLQQIRDKIRTDRAADGGAGASLVPA